MTVTVADFAELTDTSDLRRCYAAFRPAPVVRLIGWSVDNVVNDQGRPYDVAAYPHLGAPGGPMDAFDDPRVRSIALQWATRLGKTFFGQCALLKTADCDPAPMMFASSVERLAKEGIARVCSACHQRDRLNGLLAKPPKLQRQDLVEFRGCKIYVAWSRSVSTLADKNIKVGHAGEYDKWEHQSTSREAHPHKLFDDRFKDYQSSRKVIYEGTPTIKGRSPIERRRLAGSNCEYLVPCPHCKRYQRLEMGGEGDAHGVRWDRGEGGRSDPSLAYRSARYVCRHCGGACGDHHRAWMMRRGVWCPEGCTVRDEQALAVAERCLTDPTAHEWRGWRHAEWVEGAPARDGVDASYQLSSLYALSLGWGDVAKEFVGSKGKPQELRNFVNQWLGETWEIAERKQTWEQLGQKVIDKGLPHRAVPAWASLLTVGVDRQKDVLPWMVVAWGPDRRCHVVDYGDAETLAAVRQGVVEGVYPREGGDHVRPAFALVDSGGATSPVGVYEACVEAVRSGVQLWPCKGSSAALDVEYRRSKLGPNTSMPGMILTMMDTARSQAWADRVLNVLQPGDAGALSLFDGSLFEHQDVLEQLLNDAPVSSLDSANNVKEAWERIDTGVPNDYRDCLRMNFIAMLIASRGNPIGQPQGPRPAVVNAGRRRDAWR